jgi:hypothetical protein
MYNLDFVKLRDAEFIGGDVQECRALEDSCVASSLQLLRYHSTASAVRQAQLARWDDTLLFPSTKYSAPYLPYRFEQRHLLPKPRSVYPHD